MRFKRIPYVGSAWAILLFLFFFFQAVNLWAQCTPTGNPLVLNYTSLSMNCGTTQTLSASGGCPPYTWHLFTGGGTLTPQGSGNANAIYDAPTSNPNCANNPRITLIDCCRNTAEIQVAINCAPYGDAYRKWQWVDGNGFVQCYDINIQGYVIPASEAGMYYWHINQDYYNCDGTFNRTVATIYDDIWTDDPNPQTSPHQAMHVMPIIMGSGLYGQDIVSERRCPPPYVTEPYFGPWEFWIHKFDCDITNYLGYNWYNYGRGIWHGFVEDTRFQSAKDDGCCPINPSTGLPLGDEGEDRTKNAGRPPCPVANPVNVATGNKYEEVLDLALSTPGIPLEFRRSYNSQVIFDGPLGYGWTHTYDLSLSVVQTTPTMRVRIWNSDGRHLYFTERSRTGSEITFYGESGITDRLKQVISTGDYFLRRKDKNLTYKFRSSDGKLIEISDPNGNALTMTYTGGLLTQVSNNFGKNLLIAYQNNRITSVTDPKGQSVAYEYSGNGDLWKAKYRDSAAQVKDFIEYVYSNHNLTDQKDTNGNVFGYWSYDDVHRVAEYYSHLVGDEKQERMTFAYPLGKTEVTRTTETGAYLTTYITNVIDEMKVVVEIDGCSTCGSVKKQFGYDGLDLIQVTSVDGANTYTTEYQYDNPEDPRDKIGEIREVTEALGWPEQRITSYTYTHRTDDPFLLTQSTETIKSVVDPQQNKIITLTYDTAGNPLSQQEAGYVLINGVPTQRTYTTSYQYNSFGQLTQIDGPRTDVSDITTIEYYANTPDQGNNRGQLKAVVNALNQRIEFSEYDANGNVGKIKDPNNIQIQYTYDERNRIKIVTNLSTTAQTQYFYDSRGNLSYIILPEANRIDFTYNLANKLTEIKDSLNNRIQYQYDVEGNRIREETKDPQGTLKKYLDFTYDAYNNLKKIINPDTTNTEYTYDERKNPTASKDPKNNTTLYTYDPLSRIKQMTQPLSTVTLYGYDTQDNQATVTDPNGNITQYYNDDFGRKNQTISPDTGTTKYTYDEAGNLAQRADGMGTIVDYTYDALNRLTAIQFPSDPNQDVTFTYDSTSVTYGIGRLTGRVDLSGSYVFYYDAHGNVTKEEKTIGGIPYTTQYTYNNNNILTSITYPSGRVITYTLDQIGRISQVSTTINGNPKTLASSINYLPYGGLTGLTYGNGLSLSQGYDNQYRISSVVTGAILNLTYGYDANGNITSILDTVNPPGGEIFENPGTYTYQTGTNKLTHIEGTPSIDYGYDANANIISETGWTYVYDLSNQLIRVLQNTTQVGEYTYNGAGQRIKKVTQTETRIFHYDLRGHLIAETNQSGQMLAEYIHLGDQLLAMIKPGEVAYYFHNDHLGAPQVLTNESQTVAWKAAYTPFGEAVTSIETVENPFRFPGQYFDPETGLHYNYFRYYNPQTGRYMTPDPIGLWGGINLFAYVRNNPLIYMDPYGNQGTNIVEDPGHSQVRRLLNKLLKEGPGAFLEEWRKISGGVVADTPNDEAIKKANEAAKLAEKIAGGHAYKKHGCEFPEIKSKEQFADHIKDILSSPSEEKQLERGRVGYWHEKSGTVVIHDPNHPEGGTAFRPPEGKKYFDEKLK